MINPYFPSLLFVPVLICFLTTTTEQAQSGNRQKIVIAPVDTKVLQGEKATLKCKVENQAGTVQWTRDRLGMGSDRTLAAFPRYKMGGSTANGEYNLEITDAVLDDDGVYQCQIGATATQTLQLSKSVKLTVLVPPAPPKLANFGSVMPGIEGRELEVSCVSELGKPAAELFWVIADNPQASGKLISIGGDKAFEEETKSTDESSSDASKSKSDGSKKRKETGKKAKKKDASRTKSVTSIDPRNSTVKVQVDTLGKLSTIRSNLKFTPKAADDGKYVVCLAKHETKKGKTHAASSKLSLEYAPIVSVRVNSSSPLLEGSSTVLRCNVDAKPPIRAIRWLRDGISLSGSDTDIFPIPHLTSEYHNQLFTCEATNAVGMRSADLLFQLAYGPKIEGGDRVTVTVNTGEDLTMSCVVDSNPKALVRWTKQFANWPILHIGANFTLKAVRPTQQGGYQCEAVVSGFPAVTQLHFVHINGRPSVSLPARVETELSTDTKLECNVSGYPAAKEIYWFKDGVFLDPRQNRRYKLRQFARGDGLVSELKISKVERTDLGVFNCTATNTEGSHFAITKLVAIDTLPLYFLIPGVILAIVLVMLLTLTLILMNRNACCARTVSRNGDSHSDVHVKVETLDGQSYPDMYSTTPIAENVDTYSKDYISVPQDNPDLDFLPPPYGHQQQQFIYQPNGSVLAMTSGGGGSSSSHHQLLPTTTNYDDSESYDAYGQNAPTGGGYVPSPSLPNGHLFHHHHPSSSGYSDDVGEPLLLEPVHRRHFTAASSPPPPMSATAFDERAEQTRDASPPPLSLPVYRSMYPYTSSTFKPPSSTAGNSLLEENRPTSRGSTHV